LVLTIFGYGQGLVMAPLSSAVLSTVKPMSAGAASGIYGTTADCECRGRRGDRCGILRDRIEPVEPAGVACRVVAVCAVDYRLRRISDVDASGHGVTN